MTFLFQSANIGQEWRLINKKPKKISWFSLHNFQLIIQKFSTPKIYRPKIVPKQYLESYLNDVIVKI